MLVPVGSLFAQVDPDDIAVVSGYQWYKAPGKNSVIYARAELRRVHGWFGPGRRTVAMHCVIMGGTGLDHINHDGLDNRRANLRWASKRENNWNLRSHRKSSSFFKGVSWDRDRSKWTAHICVKGKQQNLGRFVLELDAALAYDKAAKKFFGEFACLNFPEAQHG